MKKLKEFLINLFATLFFFIGPAAAIGYGIISNIISHHKENVEPPRIETSVTKKDKETGSERSSATDTVVANPVEDKYFDCDYVANKNTKKFHNPSCYHADQINEENLWEFNGTRDYLIEHGYEPCGDCDP